MSCGYASRYENSIERGDHSSISLDPSAREDRPERHGADHRENATASSMPPPQAKLSSHLACKFANPLIAAMSMIQIVPSVVTAPTPPPRLSIVVLPFANIGAGQE